MNRRIKLLLPALAAALLALPAAARTNVDIDVRINGSVIDIGTPPPTIRLESAPLVREGYAWAPGFWRWDGRGHVWVPGAWLPARPGYVWVGERWQQNGSHWHFAPGHWGQYSPPPRAYHHEREHDRYTQSRDYEPHREHRREHDR